MSVQAAANAQAAAEKTRAAEAAKLSAVAVKDEDVSFLAAQFEIGTSAAKLELQKQNGVLKDAVAYLLTQ